MSSSNQIKNPQNEIQFSPLTLGTVQLGLRYGIANESGKPDRTKAEAILKEALLCGITMLDTARHYGDSEAIIGEFLVKQRVQPQTMCVVSKFKWSRAALTDARKARREARESVQKSLAALRISELPVLLYHKGKDEPMGPLVRLLSDVFRELREEGLVRKGGISLYYPEEVEAVVEMENLQAVQVPISVFDGRVVHTGGLARLHERACTVFARSVFLQGLFFLDEHDIPINLQEAVPFLRRLREITYRSDWDLAQFAFSYVRHLAGVTSVVVGAETPSQVRKNATLLSVPPLSAELCEEVATAFRHMPPKVITPGMW